MQYSPQTTLANGSERPDASEPIKDLAWYMCALSWKYYTQKIMNESDKKGVNYVFFGVMDRNRRSECGTFCVEQFVGHLEARRKAAWKAFLMFRRSQPEVDLKFRLNHPAAGADSAATRKLKIYSDH